MITNRQLFKIAIAAAAFLPLAASATAKNRTVLDVKTEITDSNIVFPESYEADTQRMMESWYMRNYTATDDRYMRQGDVETSDEVIKDRLAKLPTVIDMPFNQIVRSYIDRYTSHGRQQVAALLGLSIYYMPIFEQALEEEGLPLELKYLPVIESSLDPTATSRHGAAGLWQFMIGTGKGMGLEVSSVVDERRDPYLSSKKAAKYLKDLYSAYNDWSLAIAAYNCGPGTINKALRRVGGKPKDPGFDFWSIYYFLSPETRGYVPQFIAANYVMNYYPYHNISPVLPSKPLVTDTIQVGNRVHFQQISHVLDIPVEELRVLNPQFRADVIPGTPEHRYTLILPSQQCNAYIMSEEDILAYESEKYSRRTDAEPGDQPSATVAQEIANESQEENEPLEADATQTGPQQQTVAQHPVAKKNGGGATVTVTHKVEAVQSLSDIAQMYQVSTDDIKSWNSLRRNAVRPGQQLRITTTSDIAQANGAKKVASGNSSPRQNNWTAQNQAKRDDTPQQASNSSKKSDKKYSDSADNSSKNKKNTKKNKKAEPAAPKSHSVKSGENLTVIAKKYGCSVEELRKANNLKGDELHPGDQLQLPSKGKKGKKGSVSSGKSSKKKGTSGKSKKKKSKKR